jgi:hypothetical protein
MTWRAISACGPLLEDAATNARNLRRAERGAADERLDAMRVSYESRLRELGRGLHSSAFRLNVSALCGIGGAP